MTAVAVSKRLADGLAAHLAAQRVDIKRSLDAWRSAEKEADTAREREAAALDAAHAAQLTDADDAEQLTTHATEAQAATGSAAYDARQARAALSNSILDAEIAAMTAAAKTLRMPPEDAELVECAVDETREQARKARVEARLGLSPEDAREQQAAERAGTVATTQTPTAEPERWTPAPKPVWERLVVTDDDERAVLDGVEHRLPRAAGAKMLRLLLAARGGLVAAKLIELNTGARPKRELGRLPRPIAELVEAPGRDRRGYRLLAAPATEGRPRP